MVSTTKAKSSKKVTAASLLLPVLPFEFLQWQNISSKFKFKFNAIDVGMPSIPAAPSNDTSITMAARYANACPSHTINPHICSSDPLIFYIADYLTVDETSYLLNLAIPHYRQSPVSQGHVLKTYDRKIRSSMSAVVPDDPVVACIAQRPVNFQAFIPGGRLEDLQVVKYGVSDHFRPHFDWFSGIQSPRVSTLIV
jgi:hypothetical protein